MKAIQARGVPTPLNDNYCLEIRMIKPTGNAHFDRLYEKWLSITKNGSAKLEGLKVFSQQTKGFKQPDISEFANMIIESIVRKHEERQQKINGGSWVPEWCSVAVYLRQKRYADETLDSIEETQKPMNQNCINHPDKPSVYAREPFLCADCICEQARRV